jgi:hypothetical protein
VIWHADSPLPKPDLQTKSIAIENIGAEPILKLHYFCWGTEEYLFLLYKDGTVVWRNELSPTNYCISHLSEEEQRQLLDLADRVEWGKDYKVTFGTDSPHYSIMYGAKIGRIHGDPNRNARRFQDYLVDPLILISMTGAWAPQDFEQLYEKLISFERKDARPWLAESVHLEIFAEERTHCKKLPSGLPAVRKSDIKLATQLPTRTGHHIYSEVQYERTLDSKKYLPQILELIKTEKASREGFLVDGRTCWLHVTELPED